MKFFPVMKSRIKFLRWIKSKNPFMGNALPQPANVSKNSIFLVQKTLWLICYCKWNKGKHSHWKYVTPSLSLHRKRRSTKRSSLQSSSRSQTRCASSVTAARTTSKRWFCDVCFLNNIVNNSCLCFFYFHISIMFKFYSVTRFVSRFARPNWVKSRRHRSSWYKFVMPLPVVDFEASELRSFVSLHDRCSSTAACCAVAPCFIDPVLGRKKVKRWNMPR